MAIKLTDKLQAVTTAGVIVDAIQVAGGYMAVTDKDDIGTALRTEGMLIYELPSTANPFGAHYRWTSNSWKHEMLGHFHDIEANWNNKKSFVPAAGEIIIYNPDSTHPYPRLKIGDGSKSVPNLPFFSEAELNALRSDVNTNTVNVALAGETLVFTRPSI